MTKWIPEYKDKTDEAVISFARLNAIDINEAYKVVNCYLHAESTGEILDTNAVEIRKVIKIRVRTANHEIVSREGLNSGGSDYWLHRDVMGEDE